jgi:uncharacterized cupin superfamily protein
VAPCLNGVSENVGICLFQTQRGGGVGRGVGNEERLPVNAACHVGRRNRTKHVGVWEITDGKWRYYVVG